MVVESPEVPGNGVTGSRFGIDFCLIQRILYRFVLPQDQINLCNFEACDRHIKVQVQGHQGLQFDGEDGFVQPAFSASRLSATT